MSNHETKPETKQSAGSDSPVALITGSAAPRVGQVVAKKLAGLGYSIAIHSNSSQKAGEDVAAELNETGTKVSAFQANLGNETECRQLVQQVHSEFGQIDVVVNSAAIWEPIPFEKVTGNDLDEYFKVNLAGSFIVAQEAGLISGYDAGTTERNNMEAEIEQKQTKLRTEARQAEAELLNREAQIYYATYQKMQSVVGKLAAEYGISLVIRFDGSDVNQSARPEVIKAVNRSVVFHRDIDITSMVIKGMGPRVAEASNGVQTK